MEEEGEGKKRKLEIDWKAVWDNGEEEEPQEVEVIGKSRAPTTPLEKMSGVSNFPVDDQQDYEQLLSDHELEVQIQRQNALLGTMASKMRDKGQKIRAKIKRLEEEKERRTLRRARMDDDELEKPTQSTQSGSFDGCSQRTTSSQDLSQSIFATCFCEKMEGKTDYGTTKAFDRDLQILGSESQDLKCNGDFSQRGRQKECCSSRQSHFQCPKKPSINGCKDAFLKGDHKRIVSTPHVLRDDDEDSVNCFAKKDAVPALPSNDSRHKKGRTIINVDEEETQLVTTTEQESKLPECVKEARIYYPSRDDPESVEICFKDMECLAPEGYLTSPIMNFYIQYLQQQASPSNRAIYDCHFFNTYFYKKLKEALSFKGNDKEAFFVKFRRWWKGVNIFQKAYVLIPIHEDLHWSLVIICIPDKEDESGPIILHLDSLAFHSSRSVFDNIRSYLKAEWNYLNQDVTPLDLPIADRIWRHLPRRIDEKILTVPQQKNDYDCGLFVLFFMERFIEEAPERLKKKDLAMFGRQWFKPEEASGLRAKIRHILLEQFKKACK